MKNISNVNFVSRSFKYLSQALHFLKMYETFIPTQVHRSEVQSDVLVTPVEVHFRLAQGHRSWLYGVWSAITINDT